MNKTVLNSCGSLAKLKHPRRYWPKLSTSSTNPNLNNKVVLSSFLKDHRFGGLASNSNEMIMQSKSCRVLPQKISAPTLASSAKKEIRSASFDNICGSRNYSVNSNYVRKSLQEKFGNQMTNLTPKSHQSRQQVPPIEQKELTTSTVYDPLSTLKSTIVNEYA